MNAPFIGIERHRMATDGEGVTTLVAFHGCTLRCRYCLNPQCLDASFACQRLTPTELLERMQVDNIYFLATGGGVTFGGGEPLMHADFIREFCGMAVPEWNISVETCLNVPHKQLEMVFPFINRYIIDVKDMDTERYRAYTSQDNNRVIANLEWLAEQGATDKVTVRLPLIDGFNTPEQRLQSRLQLEIMGYREFDEFEYITNIRDYKRRKR